LRKQLAPGSRAEGEAHRADEIEGNSIRSTMRITGIDEMTITRISIHASPPGSRHPLRGSRTKQVLVLRASVKHFMPAFRDWQSQTVINLLNAHGDTTIIRRTLQDASATLSDWTDRFKHDVAGASRHNTEMGIVSSLALFGIPHAWLGALLSLVPTFFKVRELRRPWWTNMAGKSWAPAGIIYEATHL
jgi:hypothetical protein